MDAGVDGWASGPPGGGVGERAARRIAGPSEGANGGEGGEE